METYLRTRSPAALSPNVKAMALCWSSRLTKGLPVIAREREDPDAPDPVGRPVLDLARRRCRVPASGGGEVSQQGPHLAN
jgi:hypothetical protein